MYKFRGYQLSVIAIALVVASCLLALHIRGSSDAFASAYREYSVLANASDIAAYVPGAANNPVRQELNSILIQALSKKMSDAERLGLAERGVELVQGIDAQIDAISIKKEETDAAIAILESHADFVSNLFSNGLPKKIIESAKERSVVTGDIRAYSYRADFETKKILQRIVQDRGALTNSFVTELNNEVPAQEKAFNDRTNRYSDLQRISQEIEDDFTIFAKRFALK